MHKHLRHPYTYTNIDVCKTKRYYWSVGCILMALLTYTVIQKTRTHVRFSNNLNKCCSVSIFLGTENLQRDSNVKIYRVGHVK